MYILFANNEHKRYRCCVTFIINIWYEREIEVDGTFCAQTVSALKKGKERGRNAFVAVASCERRATVKWKDLLGRNGERGKECTTSHRDQSKSLMG